jgi:hypothetical protein
MGVVVKDVSERPLSTVQAVVRDAVPLVFAVHDALSGATVAFTGGNPFVQPDAVATPFLWFGGLWSVLEILTMLTNSKRRGLHDLIALRRGP